MVKQWVRQSLNILHVYFDESFSSEQVNIYILGKEMQYK